MSEKFVGHDGDLMVQLSEAPAFELIGQQATLKMRRLGSSVPPTLVESHEEAMNV
jgi:hypothetical protein